MQQQSDRQIGKQMAGEEAVKYIENGMVIGIGTGTTAAYMIHALAQRLRRGLTIMGAVPTSQATAQLASSLGIPLTDLDAHPQLDLVIDGADEIDSQLRLIKGGGGALLREKIVATASRRFIVIADTSKLVPQLGQTAPVPVETIPFAMTPVHRQLRERDAQRRQRVSELLAQGGRSAPDDYFHAALIFQHGETLEDIWQAHELARKAAELGATQSMGSKDSHWLAAAALDRWLMYQGKPQKYGTQFVPDGKCWRLWDVDADTTDAERLANYVPALQEQLTQAERNTQEGGFGIEKDKAPQWLREALERWEQEG